MGKLERRRPERERGLSRRWRSPFTRFFEDFLSDMESEFPEVTGWTGRGRFTPALDVEETEDNITVSAEVPGMDKNDIEITVTNGVLTLRGEKREETEEGEGQYHRVERRYGRFERAIPLPDYADQENIDATYHNGVLTLDIPKTEKAKPKQIEVKEG
jgi:HSP20 family protein